MLPSLAVLWLSALPGKDSNSSKESVSETDIGY